MHPTLTLTATKLRMRRCGLKPHKLGLPENVRFKTAPTLLIISLNLRAVSLTLPLGRGLAWLRSQGRVGWAGVA